MGSKFGKSLTATWQEDRYREILRSPGKAEPLLKIWRDAFQDDYPEDADPFGFVTLSDLRRFASELKIENGNRLLDVGCGRGGPGLWVARNTGANLVGVDILAEAITQANESVQRLGLAGSASFSVGSFVDTGLPTASAQAIMSVDAFWMVLDKAAALNEMARVIQLGGRFVMTTWIPPYLDLESLLAAARFHLISREETSKWRERQIAVYRGILRNRRELESVLGGAAVQILMDEANQAPAKLLTAPRYLVIAERLS
jgi:ubiquinone/menaquinone biosynthesis C-methylase UbiE